MRVDRLKEFLDVLPDDMEVYLQTCEEDLCTPLQFENVTISQAFVHERYGLHKSNLIFTAFIKGGKTYSAKNKRAGFIVTSDPESDERLKQPNQEG